MWTVLLVFLASGLESVIGCATSIWVNDRRPLHAAVAVAAWSTIYLLLIVEIVNSDSRVPLILAYIIGQTLATYVTVRWLPLNPNHPYLGWEGSE